MHPSLSCSALFMAFLFCAILIPAASFVRGKLFSSTLQGRYLRRGREQPQYADNRLLDGELQHKAALLGGQLADAHADAMRAPGGCSVLESYSLPAMFLVRAVAYCDEHTHTIKLQHGNDTVLLVRRTHTR